MIASMDSVIREITKLYEASVICYWKEIKRLSLETIKNQEPIHREPTTFLESVFFLDSVSTRKRRKVSGKYFCYKKSRSLPTDVSEFWWHISERQARWWNRNGASAQYLGNRTGKMFCVALYCGGRSRRYGTRRQLEKRAPT